MRAHNALVQDPIWVLHKALTCADLDLCDSKRRLPLVGDFSPFSEEAILKVKHWWNIFCWLHISMSTLIFCLMFPPTYIHIWVDLRSVNALKKSVKGRKNCFNRQRAVRILKVCTLWCVCLSICGDLNTPTEPRRIQRTPGESWLVLGSPLLSSVLLKDRMDKRCNRPVTCFRTYKTWKGLQKTTWTSGSTCISIMSHFLEQHGDRYEFCDFKMLKIVFRHHENNSIYNNSEILVCLNEFYCHISHRLHNAMVSLRHWSITLEISVQNILVIGEDQLCSKSNTPNHLLQFNSSDKCNQNQQIHNENL